MYYSIKSKKILGPMVCLGLLYPPQKTLCRPPEMRHSMPPDTAYYSPSSKYHRQSRNSQTNVYIVEQLRRLHPALNGEYMNILLLHKIWEQMLKEQML